MRYLAYLMILMVAIIVVVQIRADSSPRAVAVQLGTDASAAPARKVLYVSTTGNDGNLGTLAAPLRTISQAARMATPGTIVYVRNGIYNERVTIQISGFAAGGSIIFQNYPNERPIIDGTGLSVPANANGLFLIQDKSYIVIKGFELRNYKTAAPNLVPAGIYISGTSHHIQLLNNIIHDLGTSYTGSDDGNGFGIAVYGTSPVSSINSIRIDSNELYNLQTGFSESLVLNGNVESFEITNNKVHHNNNIGIDIIGFEGTCPDAALDQARNGTISGNLVYNNSSKLNPAYQGDTSADGIYVDGGSDVIIERNTVYNNDIGVELASEHAGRATTAVIARNNFIYRNNVVGLSLGFTDDSRELVEWLRQNC